MEKNDVPKPGEIYRSPQKIRIVGVTILGIFVLATILVGILAPSAELDYLFGSTSMFNVLLIASVVIAIFIPSLFDEHRNSKIYLNEKGELDLSSPRDYTPLKVSFISNIFGRANPYYQKNLKEFRYSDGIVYIENSKGDIVEGPLSELTFKYKMDKSKISGEWYIYQYHITDAMGNKVQFNRHSTKFTDEENADIEMLLSLCGEVKESKISKFTKMLDKTTSLIDDVDFSNVVESVTDKALDATTTSITNKVGKVAKRRLYDKRSEGKKKTLKKIMNYVLIGIIALYLLAVIIVNISNISNNMESNAGDKSYVAADTSLPDTDIDVKDPAIDDNSSSEATSLHYSGTIDGKYEISMTISSDGKGEYYYVKNGPGATLKLIITQLDDNGKIVMEEYDDNGGQTGLFEGRIDSDRNMRGFFTNHKGTSMPFFLELE